MRTVFFMKQKKKYKYIENFLFEIQSEGKLYFSIEDLINKFPNNSLNSIQMNLKRLKKKNLIRHIANGFYVIIPPVYSHQKMIPIELFINAFFEYLNRKYYIGLLSAAFYHGASHQQPQEYFVIINKPAMRSLQIEGTVINFVVKSNIEKSEIENKKSETGYFKISSPEQTAIDLIYFQNRIGGLNRASTVIYELADSMDAKKLSRVIQQCKSNAALQRLGYILDNIVKRKDLSAVIFKLLKNRKLYRVSFKPAIKKSGFPLNAKWKIVENHKVETDFQQ